jgi:hypothetical protein
MNILIILLSIILSIFSTAVMSYISMATPIGPWIAPTLVLMAMLVVRLFYRGRDYGQEIVLATFSGSIGGILATSFGFSFPTLYFLDPVLFNSWMSSPLYFAGIMSALALSAGGFGFWIANMLQERLIMQEELEFPVSQLVHKMVAAQQSMRKAIELMVGFVGTAIFCVLQDGVGAVRSMIPKAWTLIAPVSCGVLQVPLISLDIWPMLWAIGFVTGHVIAIPLLVGACSRILIIDTLRNGFYPDYGSVEFILAFSSGMIVAGTVFGFLKTPQVLWHSMRRLLVERKSDAVAGITRHALIQLVGLLFMSAVLFSYFEFSILAQLYLIFFTFACTYEIANQTGKIGLARLGMFATFVMVPAMLLFNLNMIQITIIATYVEVCGGVAADVLFGRKMIPLMKISQKTMQRYQLLGLVVSSLCVGGVFWLLINHFGLGTPELFAQKAKNRELLVAIKQFDWRILLMGFGFGYLLRRVHVNPSLVLGGILMPINVSLGLIIGGLGTYLVKDKEEWYPFWSGVFASNSLWMLIRSVL